jgi:tryptophan synthase beta chain
VPYLLPAGLKPEHAAQLAALRLPGLVGSIEQRSLKPHPAVKDAASRATAIQSLKPSYLHMTTTYHLPLSAATTANSAAPFIPEMLYPNVEELRQQYRDILASEDFQRQYQQLLRDYVGRPTPLFEAKRLSEKYNTRIFLKREDLCHTGAHKINNTVGQILLAQRLGKTRIIAETGAGQHGVATATVCALMGLPCVVYMGEIDMERQKPNVYRMRLLGAEVRAATSGSRTLKDATNEAIRDWIANPVDTHYIIGSVVGPHPYPDLVARLQAVISEEMRAQLLEKTGSELPDYVVACVGGGSNAAGAFYHFLEEPSVQLVAVEAAGQGVNSGHSAATSVLGTPGIIHGARTLLMQDEHGQITEPYSLSAGLDYPGIGPLHAFLADAGRARFIAIEDEDALLAVAECSRLEGIIPALETAHALAALGQLGTGPDDVVVLNLSGRGDKDLETYIKYADKLT